MENQPQKPQPNVNPTGSPAPTPQPSPAQPGAPQPVAAPAENPQPSFAQGQAPRPGAVPERLKSLDELIGSNAKQDAGDIIITPDQPSAKKNPNKKLIITLAAALVGLAVIIGVVLLIMNLNKKPETVSPAESSAKTETAKTEKTLTSAEKEAAVKEVLTELKAAVTTTTNPAGAAEETNDNTETTTEFQDVYDSASPLYKPEDMEVGLAMEKSFGIYYTKEVPEGSDLSDIRFMVNKIRSKLEELGFSIYTGVELTSGTTEYINEADEIICSGIETTLPLTISCSHLSWLSAEKIALVDLLAKAYYEKEKTYPAIIDATQADVKNSIYEPYQKLTASLGDAAGLFYRATKSASWVFFAGTQAALPCEDYYADTGARRAFAGDVCYDKTTQENSTVQVN